MTALVTDFLEGALSFSRRTAARLHLRFCPACARYFDQMRLTTRLLADSPAPPPPDEATVEGIMARRPEAPRRR
jgi:anti-sigma factor RsiW